MIFKKLTTMFKNNINEVETKSLPYQSSIELITQAPYVLSRDAFSLLKNQKGIAYTCQQKNSSAVANANFRLFANINKNKLGKWVNYRDVSKKTFEFMKHRKSILQSTENVVEIVEHPFLDLIYNVNDRYDKYSLFEQTENYLGTLGNCYWLINKEEGLPIGIDILPSEYISIVLDNSNKIIGYKMQYNNVITNFEKDDIIHFKNPVAGTFSKINSTPLTNLYGMGNMEAVRDEIELLNLINTYEMSMLNNNGRPDIVVSYKGKLQEKEKKELYRLWNKVFGGVKNAGKAQIADGDFDVKNLGFAPKDLSYQEGKKYLITTVANAYGVPVDLIMTENSNRASSDTAIAQYMQFTITPKLRKIEETITQNLLKYWDTNLFMVFDNQIPENEDLQSQIFERYVRSGIMTIEEVRNIIGLETNEKN